MSDRDRSSPSLTDTPLKTYIGRHDDDYPLINGNGKSVNSKDTLEDKKDDSELWEAQAAFLGPNLWDKTLPYDPDLKVQEYVDLDEFLSENGMQGEALGGAHLGGSAFGPGAGLALGLQAPVTKRERSPSPSDCMSPDTINPPLSPADSTFSMASSGRDFDPRTRAFSDEELKPQPMIKKSRKQVNEFVPDDLKDDKYWARRRKNNMAAKRSRDARRMKENQIALRAGYLEKENMGLRQEVELLKKENHILREKLSKYADV
ncbi:PAR bZIP family member Pdp1 isoform X7 [Choristoneura fumiferana]|uniref:PAR bZIP family member Pdp1 isoform X7 n=1 Tax=Choristoneura fumiferana TaxID=7141 RepID=UPI003D15596A